MPHDKTAQARQLAAAWLDHETRRTVFGTVVDWRDDAPVVAPSGSLTGLELVTVTTSSVEFFRSLRDAYNAVDEIDRATAEQLVRHAA